MKGEIYPKVGYENRSFLERECTECGIKFWHASDKVIHCGDVECNRQNLQYKIHQAHMKYDFKSLVADFNQFFSVKRPLFNSSYVVPRAHVPVVYSSTQMAFLCAGCAAYQPLMDEQNERLKHFSKDLFISNHFCYRFYDKANLQITGRHNTGFFMLGLHCFEGSPEAFADNWKTLWFDLLLSYFLNVLKIPLQKIYVHADSWNDGVNGGPSVEFFVNGIEVGNMVFTEKYILGDAHRTLRYLDVGLGAERLLNLVSKVKLEYFDDLVYDHLRSIVVAVKDGILPSKVGLGYNVRKLVEALLKRVDLKSAELQQKLEHVIQHLLEVTSQSQFKDLPPTLFKMLESEYDRCNPNYML